MLPRSPGAILSPFPLILILRKAYPHQQLEQMRSVQGLTDTLSDPRAIFSSLRTDVRVLRDLFRDVDGSDEVESTESDQ